MKEIRFHHANLAKHGVTPEEVKECLHNRRNHYRQRIRAGTYRILGQTLAGRYLELLYSEEPEELFVFHAMDARERDIKLLKRKRRRP